MKLNRAVVAALLLVLMEAGEAGAQDFVVQYASPQLQRRVFGFFQREDAKRFASDLRNLEADVRLDEIDWAVSYRLPEVKSRRFFTSGAADAFRSRVAGYGLRVSEVVRDGFDVLIYDFNTNRLTVVRGASPAPVYYVRYACVEEKTTGKMLQEEAEALADRLKQYGAKTKLLNAGAVYDDPQYPTKVLRYFKVWYNQPNEAELRCEGAFQTDLVRSELQSFSFRTKVADKPGTEDSKLPEGSPGERNPKGDSVPAMPNGWSSWQGFLGQEDVSMPMRLKLVQKNGEITGELQLTYKGQARRAELRGEINGDEVTFTTTKVLEGRLYVPTMYSGRLKGRKLKGTWEYAQLRIAGEFEVTLDQK